MDYIETWGLEIEEKRAATLEEVRVVLLDLMTRPDESGDEVEDKVEWAIEELLSLEDVSIHPRFRLHGYEAIAQRLRLDWVNRVVAEQSIVKDEVHRILTDTARERTANIMSQIRQRGY